MPMIMDDELEKMWKKVVVTYFMVLLRHLPERAKKIHEKLESGWLVSQPTFSSFCQPHQNMQMQNFHFCKVLAFHLY